MIAPITTVLISLLAFAAAQVDTDGATDSAPAFTFAPASSSDVPAFADDVHRTMSTQTELDAPNTTAPTGTPSVDGPRASRLAPVTASSESNLDMPTSSPTTTPSSSPEFAFAPTTTSPSFAFAPTTSSSSPSFAFAPTTSSMEFSFQPQTQSSQPQTSPVTTKPSEPGQNTAIVESSDTQLEQPTTTPEFTYSPSTKPSFTPSFTYSPSFTPSFTYSPSTTPSTTPSFTYNPAPPPPPPSSSTPGNPVEQHPNLEQSATSLIAPSPILAPSVSSLEKPSPSTITGAPIYKTLHVSQASNGNFMYGSHTLSPGAEITQGANPTQIIDVKSSSEVLIENAQTTETQYLAGRPSATVTVRPVPSLHGGYILSAAPQEWVTLNGYTMAVSSVAVATEKAIAFQGHTVSMGGVTLVARPTAAAAAAKSSQAGAESSRVPDSGVGRVGAAGSVVCVLSGLVVGLML